MSVVCLLHILGGTYKWGDDYIRGIQQVLCMDSSHNMGSHTYCWCKPVLEDTLNRIDNPETCTQLQDCLTNQVDIHKQHGDWLHSTMQHGRKNFHLVHILVHSYGSHRNVGLSSRCHSGSPLQQQHGTFFLCEWEEMWSNNEWKLTLSVIKDVHFTLKFN